MDSIFKEYFFDRIDGINQSSLKLRPGKQDLQDNLFTALRIGEVKTQLPKANELKN